MVGMAVFPVQRNDGLGWYFSPLTIAYFICKIYGKYVKIGRIELALIAVYPMNKGFRDYW